MTKNYEQSCAIPYRIQDNQISFCLITSRSHNDWIFPKGNIDGDETPEQTALKEADEEAGLEGKIVADLGSFSYKKRGYTLATAAQLMEVTLCKDRWLERKCRQRRWVTFQEAQNLIQRSEMRIILVKAVQWISQI